MANEKVGSGAWFNAQADKLIDTGLDFLRYKLIGGASDTGDRANTSNTSSTLNSPLTSALPYVLGGIAVVGIVVLLAKR